MIEFASVVGAARCASEIQSGIYERNSAESTDKRIELRIGIHVGDIIIDSDDIFGDGVNIAARLEGIADPGGVCFSRAAYEQVKGKLDVLFEDGGEQKLKNITQSVHVYHVKIGKKSPVRPSAVSLPENSECKWRWIAFPR